MNRIKSFRDFCSMTSCFHMLSADFLQVMKSVGWVHGLVFTDIL